MRLTALLLLTVFPFASHAETIEATSRVVSVTLYPWGANVVRRVEFSAPPGVHDLIVPDLPQGTPASSLRVAAADGLKVGAVNLATDRLPAMDDNDSPEVEAARAEVERLEDVLRERDAAIAEIRLRVDAANEQWTFLRALGQSEGVAERDAEDLRALVGIIGSETLAARQAAYTAEQEAKAAERARGDDAEALKNAQQNLAALTTGQPARAVLTMAVEATEDGATSLDVTTFTQNAGWRPVYDMRLTRGETNALAIERGVLINQSSGEDWSDVTLTLSTARPAEQSAPSDLSPWRRFIWEEKDVAADAFAGAPIGRSESDLMMSAAPEMESVIIEESAQVEMQGATVVYTYGNAVDIRDGVEELRLDLDTLELAPEIAAVAVPSRDQQAFLVAEMTNATSEVILPGTAYMFVDGAFVGERLLPLVAAGDEVDLGFGPIDGLRLTRTIPQRSEGERGLITTSNRIDEAAILKIENLTGEAWPVRMLDRVPYSEQDDLEISYNAVPRATETDVDGQRGVLAWEFDLAPGASREITLEHSITWPEGYRLR